jgi:hypothetical protein
MTVVDVSRGAWVVAYREVLRFVRERSRIVASVTFPLLFLAILGDAIRQVFLGSDPAAARLGVTVFGRTMGLGAEMAMVSALGLILIVSAVLAFSRQE